jgi:hypothetical protein
MVQLTVAPGDTLGWTSTYSYYTIPKQVENSIPLEIGELVGARF